MGRGQPANTGTSARPARVHSLRAFKAVRANGTLPATAVTPRTSIWSGEASANNSATASSWPGSQSMMTGRAGIVSDP